MNNCLLQNCFNQVDDVAEESQDILHSGEIQRKRPMKKKKIPVLNTLRLSRKVTSKTGNLDTVADMNYSVLFHKHTHYCLIPFMEPLLLPVYSCFSHCHKVVPTHPSLAG